MKTSLFICCFVEFKKKKEKIDFGLIFHFSFVVYKSVYGFDISFTLKRPFHLIGQTARAFLSVRQNKSHECGIDKCTLIK